MEQAANDPRRIAYMAGTYAASRNEWMRKARAARDSRHDAIGRQIVAGYVCMARYANQSVVRHLRACRGWFPAVAS